MSGGNATLLIGEAARSLGVTESQLRKACDSGVLDVPRAGRIRLFPVDRLGTFREALTDAGILPAPPSLALPPLTLNPFPGAVDADE